MINVDLSLSKLFSLVFLIFGLSACSALAPASTNAPTPELIATHFPVIERETVLYPAHEPLPELTVVLPTSPPIDVEESFSVDVPEIDCISTMPDGWIWYEVQPGDTLEKLGKRTDITVDELAEVNCLEENEHLVPGSLIFIPEQK